MRRWAGGLLARVGRRGRDGVGLGLAVAGWVAVLLLVAAAGEAVVVQRAARPDTQPTDGGATATTVPAVGPTRRLPATRPGGPVGGPTSTPGAMDPGEPGASTTAPPFDFGTSDPLDPSVIPPGLLPPFPGLELPPLPAELRQLVAVTSPTARQACSLVGTIVVLSALVKGDLEAAGVPVAAALTYLGPVFQVCELFPADEPSICAVDTALNEALIPEDLRLLVGVPSLAALAVDQAVAIETVLELVTGAPLPPGLSGILVSALGCEVR